MATTDEDSTLCIFLATHPRSMSTALERSFMTRPDLECFHEPFGDPFYYGPERLSDRYAPRELENSPYAHTTYADVVNEIFLTTNEQSNQTKKRVLLKDMAQYIIPPNGPSSVADSFNVNQEKNNPTVIPLDILHQFKFVFLIRSPHLSIPSYYRNCIAPRSEKTGFDHFRPSEAGYRELRLLYDHLVKNDDTNHNFNPLIVDAADICANPEMTIRRICESVDLEFDPSMLSWEPSKIVSDKFAKWPGWHDEVLKTSGFKAHKDSTSISSDFVVDFDSWEKTWSEKFDQEGVATIRRTVQNSLDDYLYLRAYKMNL
jgi:hypothetical protein